MNTGAGGGFIGRPLPRFEDARLVRGAGQFTDDFRYPNQAFAAFVRSPHAHARIVKIDATSAQAAPGILAVLTGADYLADGYTGIAHAALPTDAVNPRSPAFQYPADKPPFDQPQLPLAVDRVRHVGEPVALVIAETAALARDAADLVHVDYAVQHAVADIGEALQPGAPSVWDAVPDNVALDGEHGERTATQAALHAAEIVVGHEFRSQRIANAQMEPRSAIGVYTPETDSFLMVAGSQGVSRQHSALAATLHVPLERVRVISPDVGGGFGPRSYLQAEQVVVVWAARRVGRPVRWTSTRAEAFLGDHQGRDSMATLRLGLDHTGRIHALAADCVYNLGAHTVGGYVPIANFSRILSSIYAIPHAFVRMRGVLTHTGCTGPFRGAGRPEAMFMLERLLDMAAERTGIDRVELRRRNLIRHDQLPYSTPLGLIYDSGDFVHNMQNALDLADWSSFPQRRAEAQARGRYAGIGMANYVEAPVGAPHERVKATVLSSGAVELVAGTQSTGQGHETSFAQVAADQLGVTPQQVRLITGDTRVVTSGGGTHSDRSMRLAGTLIVDACGQIRERSRQVAANLLEVAPEDLVYQNAGWSAAGTDRRVSLFEAARTDEISAEATFTGRIPAHPTGCAVCEVEVDSETGAITLSRYTAVDDVGQPINPLILHGQVAGGIAQGIGQALSEHTRYEPGSGQLLTSSFLDYAIPRASGVPDFLLELTEDPTPGNPLRVKGGGEAGITPCLAAVVNALVDALRPLGIRHLEMPVTSARIRAAIAQAQDGAPEAIASS
ncbi:MAG: xanthine dehydrogenase family protein molybdopterin-binding subunit [Chloroflexi bacterium]|nr:xanthine dehydrogenase family protein molybdopterin-binding subunit [Chloroflexota bacterium]